MMEPITLDPARYWELRARLADLASAREAVRQASERLRACCDDAMAAYPGLNLSVNSPEAYTFRDADCSLVPTGHQETG